MPDVVEPQGGAVLAHHSQHTSPGHRQTTQASNQLQLTNQTRTKQTEQKQSKANET